MVVIVNYGVGNVASILNMLKKIGVEAKLSSSPEDLLVADHVILPGVGSFDYAMKALNEYKYVEAILHYALTLKRPLLGICLGMQMLGLSSEEGELPGLGLIQCSSKRFQLDRFNLRVPHMGWNRVKAHKPNIPLFVNFSEDYRFYFVHSYYVECQSQSNILLTSEYGIEFTSGVQQKNIFGVQFHPEKSHRFGMQLLKNFTEINDVS